jgi:hypothetical protein
LIPDAGSNIKIKLFSFLFRLVTAAPSKLESKIELILNPIRVKKPAATLVKSFLNEPLIENRFHHYLV